MSNKKKKESMKKLVKEWDEFMFDSRKFLVNQLLDNIKTILSDKGLSEADKLTTIMIFISYEDEETYKKIMKHIQYNIQKIIDKTIKEEN